jgi:hypothetical protein
MNDRAPSGDTAENLKCEPGPPPKATVGTVERLGVLLGDRLCVKCGYNLAGQQIVHEPHYGMAIVRCSECGTVAGVQEYPLLGRWASRWAVVLVGLWLVFLLMFLFATCMTLTVMSIELSEQAARPLAVDLAERQVEWLEREGVINDERTRWQFRTGAFAQINPQWRAQQDVAELRRTMNMGVFHSHEGNLMIAMFAPWVFAFGLAWGLMVPHVGRRWLPLVGLAIAVIAAVFITIGMSMGGYPSGRMLNFAREVLGVRIWLPGVALIVVMIVGMMLSRSLARLLVRLLLPPRLRGTLSPLWLIDGLEPPSGKLLYRSLYRTKKD